jgi:hypothetical protein
MCLHTSASDNAHYVCFARACFGWQGSDTGNRGLITFSLSFLAASTIPRLPVIVVFGRIITLHCMHQTLMFQRYTDHGGKIKKLAEAKATEAMLMSIYFTGCFHGL